MKVQLVVVEGKPLGAVIPLKADPFVIGRDPSCQLRPKGDGVSGRQCAILRRGPHIAVRDLGSARGTLVNDRCLRTGDEMRVSDGDRLQVGHLIFAIRIDEEAREAAADDPAEDVLLAGRSGMFPALSGLYPAMSGYYQVPGPAPRAPVPLQPRPAPRPESPGPAEGSAGSAFAYRIFDPEAGAACLGLSQGQVAGEADQRELRRTLRELARVRRPCRMVLDLSDIDELPSLCVATIMGLARLCEADGGELRLCGGSQPAKAMYESLRFEDVVAYYSDRTEAFADPWG